MKLTQWLFALLLLTACTAPAGDQATQAEESAPVYVTTVYKEMQDDDTWTETIESIERQDKKFVELEVWEGRSGWTAGWKVEQCVLPCDDGVWVRFAHLSDEKGEQLSFPTKAEILNHIAAAGFDIADVQPINATRSRYTFSR